MAGDEDGVRAGEVQAQVVGPPEHAGGTQAPAQQRVEDLAPLGLLPAGDVVAGQLEALDERGDAVVGRPQHREPGRPHPGGVVRQVQRLPQPPARRQVQVDERTQRHPGVGGAGAPGAAALELGPAQPTAARRGRDRVLQEVAEQSRVEPAGVVGRAPRDRTEVELHLPLPAAGSRHPPTARRGR